MNTLSIVHAKKLIQDILSNIEKISYDFKRQRLGQGILRHQKTLDLLVSLIEQYGPDSIISEVIPLDELLKIIKDLMHTQETTDYVLLIDIYEYDLKPFLIHIQNVFLDTLGIFIDEELVRTNILGVYMKYPEIVNSLFTTEIISESISKETYSDMVFHQFECIFNECTSNGVLVESTPLGHYTIAIQKEHPYYIHSRQNVVSSSILLAEEWLNQNKDTYLFYGLGFGYPYMEFLENDFNSNITVIETNKYVLQLAFLFSPIAELVNKENFTLLYDPDYFVYTRNSNQISETYGAYVLYPTISYQQNTNTQNTLSQYFVEESSIRSQQKHLVGNIKNNIKIPHKNINDLKEKLFQKNIVIVAGGPSLDKNINELKYHRDKYIIIAVGTVLKKMIHLNIIPDYTIIIDANTEVYKQIEGIENCSVPLIFLSSTLHPLVKNYNAEKFLLFQKGLSEAEKYAKTNKLQTISSGGSVATAALDLCLAVNAKKIIFIGLDLAFTNNSSHASDTPLQSPISDKTEIQVPAVNGGTIGTGRNLKLYLDWIENRISSRNDIERKIPIIDCTEGGAIKKGMLIATLKSTLESL